MAEATGKSIITPEQFDRQRISVTKQLGILSVDKLVVAAVSGMPTTQIAPALGLTPAQVGVLPTGKIGKHYEMGRIVRFAQRNDDEPGCLTNQVVVAGDEGANEHGLLPKMEDEIAVHGGQAHSYAFIARRAELHIMPEFYGEICEDEPSKPYWKFGWREPGVGDVIARARRSDVKLNAMIAIGSLTAAAETASALGIEGMYVGGLPYDSQGGIVADWLEPGDCERRNVMVFGGPDVDLEHVAHMVRHQANGTPYIFQLEQSQYTAER